MNDRDLLRTWQANAYIFGSLESKGLTLYVFISSMKAQLIKVTYSAKIN